MSAERIIQPGVPAIHRWLGQPALLALWSVVAAFGTYACMYGLRKPFTAAGFAGGEFPVGFKVWLVTAQVLGYTLSKFIGIGVIAGMPPAKRAGVLLGLVGAAELALILFGLLPPHLSVVCLFLNGLPLGMVFGLVLGFLEGRRMTEALVAGLCASFILADGFSKSIGSLILGWGVPDRWMPAAAGLMFLVPLVGFVGMLRQIPPPTSEDIAERSERSPMKRSDRLRWLQRHGLGIGLISLGYLLITILRSLRADFAPELWVALGTKGQPGVFTRSEIWVTLGVVAVNGSVFLVRDNRRSFFLALAVSLGGLIGAAVAVVGQRSGALGGFPFMVFLGLGLYLPYVAVHTTVFERLIAMTRDRGNLGYLLYLADAFGYLGYVAVMVFKLVAKPEGDFLEFFHHTALVTLMLAVTAFAGAWAVFAVRRTAAGGQGE